LVDGAPAPVLELRDSSPPAKTSPKAECRSWD
jgi:hypothetical protein